MILNMILALPALGASNVLKLHSTAYGNAHNANSYRMCPSVDAAAYLSSRRSGQNAPEDASSVWPVVQGVSKRPILVRGSEPPSKGIDSCCLYFQRIRRGTNTTCAGCNIYDLLQ